VECVLFSSSGGINRVFPSLFRFLFICCGCGGGGGGGGENGGGTWRTVACLPVCLPACLLAVWRTAMSVCASLLA